MHQKFNFFGTRGLRIASAVIAISVVFVLVLQSISVSYNSTLLNCQSNVKLVAQHLERVTQQSVRVVKGIAVWLATHPDADFRSDSNLLALSPVMNIDAEDTHAIAIIAENGQAWLLDEKFEGKSFDVSERPYFKIVKSMAVGEINYGPRTKNTNTGQDTIAVFYKVMHKGQAIAISTAFSVRHIEGFLSTIVNESNLSLQIFNKDHLEIATSNDANYPVSENLQYSKFYKNKQFSSLPNLSAISCSQPVQNSPFIIVDEADPYDAFSKTIPLILVIIMLILIALVMNTQSARHISKLLSKLRRHHENTPLGCISWDENFRCTEWNKSAEAMFGFSAKEAIGAYALELIVPEVDRENISDIYNLLLEQKGGTNNVNENVTKNGSVIICDWYNTPITDLNGKVSGVTSLVADITERKLLEEQARRSQKMEAVGQLTGGIAHDFNNLMAIMMGNLELAMEQVKQESSVGKKIEFALQAIRRGAALTQHLLSFSRQQALSPVNIGVTQLVDSTLSFLKRTLGEEVQIVTNYSNIESHVFIDADVFGNALVNLAINARDAMPNGGTLSVHTSEVELKGEAIGLHKTPVHGSFALITIADTGVGISDYDLGQVMEPFFTTKDVGKGSGLGLSMVFGFVTQSGGYVSIDSKVKEGTTVSIYLPISNEERPATHDEFEISSQVNFGKTILVVEDDPQVRSIAVLMLESLGCNVIEAEDGPTALNILNQRSNEIDIVFSDVVMPKGMSGVDLAKQILAEYPNIKVLLASGYPDKIANPGEIKGMNIKLLAKPYRKNQLVVALEKIAHNEIVD